MADTPAEMSFPVFIPTRYESRYSLLGAMGEELAEAARDAGWNVNPPESMGQRPGVLLWTNFLADDKERWRAVTDPRARLGLVQFFVDHPLALSVRQMDRLVKVPHFRQTLPCVDGAHLIRLRWPGLRHTHCLHGVPKSALCDRDEMERRHLSGDNESVVVMGSIQSREEIDAMWEQTPQRVHRGAREMVEMLLARPWTPFEQALDVAIGADGVMPGEWTLAAGLFRVVMAEANRRRRVSIVQALQGLPVMVYGGEAWREVCGGTIRYAGEAAYKDSANVMAASRVCLAWGPTQFTHSFSERILLSLAAGCATIADDRLLVRRHFTEGEDGPCARLFDAAAPESAREAVEQALREKEESLAMARRGRDLVERAHLWSHRLPTLLNAGAEALAA